MDIFPYVGFFCTKILIVLTDVLEKGLFNCCHDSRLVNEGKSDNYFLQWWGETFSWCIADEFSSMWVTFLLVFLGNWLFGSYDAALAFWGWNQTG